jgi:hypothetical protein
MTAIHETASGLQFLQGLLSSDTTLMSLSPGGVRRGFAPVGTPMPVTIIAFMSGIDTVTANGRRLLVRALYQCRASGPILSTPSVFALASQIDLVLGGNQGLRNIAATGGYVLSCYRESAVQFDDNVSGADYTHMGGLYRVTLQQM